MRALSWWISWEDLELGNRGLYDKIQRRADAFAEASADTAVIFGAHFRWDFLPYWNMLHASMREASTALAERGIVLYDHHSCTLTHRYDSTDKLKGLMYDYLHHLPFAPSGEAVADWRFNGDYLNSWRMVDARTGQAAKVPQYSAEEYCFNNPGFRAGYRKYLSRLLAETGISGLMCDDTIFFGGFYQCACPHCQEKLGFKLPPASDRGFWGNWENPLWLKYLAMRRDSIGDFMEYVKASLPPDFPLMSCCSSCAYGGSNYCALRAQELLRGDNILNLEVVGDSPGDVRAHLATNSFHAGVAQEYGVPVVSEGYGFYPDSANHLWALNNMTGFSTWFSTLKGHLGLPREEVEQLPNDAEPMAQGFAFEKEHPELFSAGQEYVCGVYFSENTQFNSYFGACEKGATGDYRWLMGHLYENGVASCTLFHFPENAGEIPCVIMPSVVLMDDNEKADMDRYLESGGVILSFGPVSQEGMLRSCEGDFEGLKWLQEQTFTHPGEDRDEWEEVCPRVYRNPSRRPSGIVELALRFGRKLPLVEAPGFAVSVQGRTIHLLAVDYELVKHPFEKHRRLKSAVSLIQNAIPKGCTDRLILQEKASAVYCPCGGCAVIDENGAIHLEGNPMYVIIELA